MGFSRILIILPDAIGDYLLITPMIRNLKSACPEMKIGVVASTRNRSLAEKNPDIDFVHLLNKRKTSSLICLLWQVRALKYEILIDLWLRRFSSALKLFVRFSGIPIKIAIEKIGRFKKLNYRGYYDQVFPIALGQTRMSYNNILEYLKALPVNESGRVIYPLQESMIKQAKGYVKGPAVVLVCEGSRVGNTLPVETCEKVIRKLLSSIDNLTIFLSASPGIGNPASRIASSTRNSRVQAIPDIDCSIDFTAAIISVAQVIISTSTATLHIADAFDKPTVGIYPRGYTTSLGDEYTGYYHFLPMTSKNIVIHSTHPANSFPVAADEIVEATLELFSKTYQSDINISFSIRTQPQMVSTIKDKIVGLPAETVPYIEELQG